MKDLQKRIIDSFGNKLRVRVCGICIEDENILMVNHQSLNESDDFWGPPGGGMDFGISAEQNLIREFREETGLVIDVEEFLFVHEYLSPPLHAIELIFMVKQKGGELKIGIDPEMAENEQIIKNVMFMPFQNIKKMKRGSVHQMFEKITSIKDLNAMNGFYAYRNIQII